MSKNKISKTNLIIFKIILIDLFVSITTLVALNFLFSFLLYKIDIDLELAKYFTFLIIIPTAVLTSYSVAKQVKNNVLLVGLMSEIPLIVFMTVQFAQNHETPLLFFIKLIIVVISGAMFGVIAVNKKVKIKVK